MLDAGFYKYYRLGGKDESVSTPNEPSDKQKKDKDRDRRELTTVYEPSHSPFGIIWQIAAATGWSVHYILWKVSYQTLALMLADAPGYRSKNAHDENEGTTTEQLFQSKFKL